jgi:hypothetical protein
METSPFREKYSKNPHRFPQEKPRKPEDSATISSKS